MPYNNPYSAGWMSNANFQQQPTSQVYPMQPGGALGQAISPPQAQAYGGAGGNDMMKQMLAAMLKPQQQQAQQLPQNQMSE